MREGRPIAPGLFSTGPEGPRLVTGRCRACMKPHFPAAPVCPYCGTEGCAEERRGGTARLWLYTVVGTRPPGYTGPLPYGLGIVELDDGLRVVTRLAETRLERLRPGLLLRLGVTALHDDDTGQPVLAYQFEPDER